MMEVIPSANYKKLLHDFSNIVHSSDNILDEVSDGDQDDEGNQESQEVSMVLANR
jgi:hypothetical protein